MGSKFKSIPTSNAKTGSCTPLISDLSLAAKRLTPSPAFTIAFRQQSGADTMWLTAFIRQQLDFMKNLENKVFVFYIRPFLIS